MASIQALPAARPRITNTLSLVRDWDRFMAGRDLSDSTRRTYRFSLLRFLSEECPEDLGEVMAADLDRFIAGFGYRAAMKPQLVRALKSFFEWAFSRGVLAHDPAAALHSRKPPPPPTVALTREELSRYLLAAAWRSERRGWALLLSYSLGTRRAEVAGIRPQDVDLESRTVLLVETKGGRKRRMELGPLSLAALEGLRPWRSPTVLGVDRSMVTQWGHQAARDAGLSERLRGRSSHVLRATFATNLLNGGTPISVVSELLGHSNIAVTSRYLATTTADRRRAVEGLEGSSS